MGLDAYAYVRNRDHELEPRPYGKRHAPSEADITLIDWRSYGSLNTHMFSLWCERKGYKFYLDDIELFNSFNSEEVVLNLGDLEELRILLNDLEAHGWKITVDEFIDEAIKQVKAGNEVCYSANW
jgi:hypothetical protein